MFARHLPRVVVAAIAIASTSVPASAQVQQVPALIRFVGEYDIPPMSLEVDDTTVGGLSGIAYDAKRDVYYVVSDDRGEFGPPRFYTLKLDIGLNGIQGVRFLGATTLDSDADTPGIQPYGRNQSDTEEIVLLPDDTLIVSSERDANNQPWLRRFALDGTLLGEIALPDIFVPATTAHGVRPNLGFEGVTWAPDERALYAMNEEALAQDGPIATTSDGTQNRLVRFDVNGDTFTAGKQAVYQTEKIFATPIPPDQAADNGVSALIWSRDVLPACDFVAMERAFVTGVGNDVNLYCVRVGDAQDVSDLAAVPRPFTGRGTDKTLLANISALGVTPDNLEGLTLGPKLADGRTALIVISDDNFSSTQVGQFLLFEI